MSCPPVDITVTSFGYLHGEPPKADLTVDLRHHFRDPHVNPALRYLTARDQEVRDAVAATPGITDLVTALAAAVTAFRSGPTTGPVTVAVGCAGGRHRAGAVARDLVQRLLENPRLTVDLVDRDLERPVVDR